MPRNMSGPLRAHQRRVAGPVPKSLAGGSCSEDLRPGPAQSADEWFGLSGKGSPTCCVHSPRGYSVSF